MYNFGMVPEGVPIIIGIAGGSGSGKTTVASVILQNVGANRIAYLPHDAYYRDQVGLPLSERAKINYDHPDSLETDLLIKHINQLKTWTPVAMPVYDFTRHERSQQTVRIEPQKVIVVEGILIFAEPDLRKQFNVKIYVDTDPDIRFIRRLQRDISERDRTMESVIQQYLNFVRPMHLEFVESSKRYADIIIPEGGLNEVALDMVIARIENLLKVEDC
jgi:uridine kinase